MKLLPLTLTALFSIGALLMGGCAANTTDGPETQGDGEEVALDEADLTAAPSNFGYFLVTHPDARKCMAPLCGGFFVKRVNETTTSCANGTKAAECYVSAIDLKGIGLSEREEQDFRAAVEGGKALIKARTYKKKWNGTNIGTLKASEGWIGATGGAPEGTFYRAADNGLRCITAPCPSTSVAELNGHDRHNVTAVILDQTTIPTDPTKIAAATASLNTAEGILIAGGVLLPKCLPTATGCGPKANASEFYLRVRKSEGLACGGWGNAQCNDGQFCSYTPAATCGAADAPGSCAYRPEVCMQLFKPVCGCDGKTYSNSCMAEAAGTSVARDGACAN